MSSSHFDSKFTQKKDLSQGLSVNVEYWTLKIDKSFVILESLLSVLMFYMSNLLTLLSLEDHNFPQLY